MKTGFKFGVAAVALTACIAGSTIWANADSEDEESRKRLSAHRMSLSRLDILNRTTARPTN